jgi:hypothetical protein
MQRVLQTAPRDPVQYIIDFLTLGPAEAMQVRFAVALRLTYHQEL